MKKQFHAAIKLLFFFTILTGLIYPLIITFFTQIAFSNKASGSIIKKEGLAIGSELIAQNFSGDIYFKPRPSAINYQPLPSGASNLSQASLTLKKEYTERKNIFLEENFLNSTYNVPKEMLFASASGVDPHISPEAALIQVDRIIKARKMKEEYKNKIIDLIKSRVENPQLGFLGEPVVNVFLLNLELDKMAL
jgi:potassium-transporting ATPase KdpC subunit